MVVHAYVTYSTNHAVAGAEVLEEAITRVDDANKDGEAEDHQGEERCPCHEPCYEREEV